MNHRHCRRFFLIACVAALAVLGPVARAADVEFAHLWPGWREAESFDRIGEYLGGGEKTGGQTVLRTQSGSRAGYYFLLRVNTPSALAGAKFELLVIRPDSPEPKTFSFPVTAPAGGGVFDLGLTGSDWPGGKKANPVAWKLTLLAKDGRVLAEHKSFLWEKPAK
jgi:hypothetical protein